MLKTAEYVSLGHPDKTADFISCYILDRMIEQDKNVKYAVEVMIKDNNVVLGGEIKGNVSMHNIDKMVVDALAEIGYTKEYAKIWKNFAIEPDKIKVINLVGKQSEEINQAVEQDGWGDQGVFVGYACQNEGFINKELFLAKKLNCALYNLAKEDKRLGLDIKTQITIDEGNKITTAIVAIPMLEDVDLKDFVVKTLEETPQNIIINASGSYTYHSSIADCGITGRKLAVDFYSTACPIGGGSPWTKDASKADLTLNLYARKLAVENLHDNDECFVYLSSCIGKHELPSATIRFIKGNNITTKNLAITKKPYELIKELGLDKSIYSKLCSIGIINAC